MASGMRPEPDIAVLPVPARQGLAPFVAGMSVETGPRMGYPLRWFEPDAVYEVTSRTIREQFWLRPCAESRDLILGVIGRALDTYKQVQMHYFVYMSNHVHMLLSSSDGSGVSSFLSFVNGNVAREIGRLRGTNGPIWAKRATAIRVLDESSMVDRLSYLLSQGCKECLVAAPSEWPGASAYPAFVGEAPLIGTWHHRDEARRARQRRTPSDATFTTSYEIALAPIPPWRGLDAAALRVRHRALVADVVRATKQVNRRLGRIVLGVAAVCEMSPEARPVSPKRGPAPLCHGSTRLVRDIYRRAYRAFVTAYRAAAETLRTAGASALPGFPPGAFPVAGMFVSWPGVGPSPAT